MTVERLQRRARGGEKRAKNGALNGVESSELITRDQRQSHLPLKLTGSLFYQRILT